MIFQRIKSINDKLFKKSWEIYCSNFPLNERRDLYEQKRIFEKYSENKDDKYNIFHFEALLKTLTEDKFLVNNDYIFEINKVKYTLVGILTYWVFPNSIFAEHLAISSNLQGLGIGKVAIDHLKEIQANNSLPIILEIELPVDHITKRRESFYKKLGLKANSHDHFQPAYHLGDEPVEMVIMTWPKEISEDDYVEFKEYQIEIMPNL